MTQTTLQNIPMREIRIYKDGMRTGDNIGFHRGFIEGDRIGYQRAVEDTTARLTEQWDAEQRAAQGEIDRAVVEHVLARGDFAAMSERRGMPELAQRQRELLAERGLMT